VALVVATWLACASSVGGGGDSPAEFDPAVYARRAGERKGEAAKGKLLVADVKRTQCLNCHAIQGMESGQSPTGSQQAVATSGMGTSAAGPDLSNVGGKLAREHLIESLLEPSRQIVEGYRQVSLRLADGRVLVGLPAGEEGGRLVLIDSRGERITVPLEEIQERHVALLSLMPERLMSAISPDEFCDLVAFLQTLRAAGQSSPGSGVGGPISLPPRFVRETIASGLTGATALATAADGRVFVCEQTGSLRVIKDDNLLDEPFVRLPVDDAWERGLIGVALDPRFDENGYVYVCYVAREPYPHHRISRFEAAGDQAKPGSEVVLLEGDDQTKLGGKVPAGHQGGALHFGPDGCLYIALGEQTAESPAQRLDSLLGKVLRIDADGTIPNGNPFVGQTTGKYRAIWARGCRNPFTFAFDPASGRMLINDVGGKAEEINEGGAGRNYGWPAAEHGPAKDQQFTGPVHWYPTASICGGAFCPLSPLSPRGRGAGVEGQNHAFPEHYRGKYFFADFVLGTIRVLDASSNERPIPAETFATGLARPVDLAFGADGSLYVLVRDAWVKDQKFAAGTSSLHRIRPRQAE
ncbi:MAG TPA: PQQ-dependent sugar dehydrogenase, partial [Pirellulaceae bacterium]|nr:PQQ-dependent sugar dehydrogenase [Pirellulaceae bacterium]